MAATPAVAGELPSGEVPSGEVPSGALSASRPPATTPPAETQQALSGVVTEAMTRCDVPGALVGVWTPAGSFESPFGLGDVAKQRPVRLADHFAIRSVTKSFVVTLILQLAAEGQLSLDDKITKYYDDVPERRRDYAARACQHDERRLRLCEGRRLHPGVRRQLSMTVRLARWRRPALDR